MRQETNGRQEKGGCGTLGIGMGGAPREVGDCGSMFLHGEELGGRESLGVAIVQGG